MQRKKENRSIFFNRQRNAARTEKRQTGGISVCSAGAREGIRTPDARFRKPTLYPLSYASIRRQAGKILRFPALILISQMQPADNRGMAKACLPAAERRSSVISAGSGTAVFRQLNTVDDIFSEEEEIVRLDEIHDNR